MTRNRMEAFSDGVLAIVITIMVLELRVPEGADLASLKPLAGTFLGYVLSFVYVGIYWNNHHHLLHTVRRVDGRILWANLHLLFWLSLMPVTDGWMGHAGARPAPVFAYGVVLLAAAIAYRLLQSAILAGHGEDSVLARALGRDRKGWASLAAYATALPLAWVAPWAAIALYAGVAVLWLVPDRRIERALAEEPS